MKKFYFLLVALFVGLAANADLYLHYNAGSGWTHTNKMTQSGSTYTYTVKNASGTLYFLVSDSSSSTWNEFRGNNHAYWNGTASINLGTEYDVYTWGQDFGTTMNTAVGSTACDVKVTLVKGSGSAAKLKVEKVAVTPTFEGGTVYFNNTQNWDSPSIHHWRVNETTWPGAAMTKVAGKQSVYSYSVPAGTTGIIFTNGKTSENGGVKTADITGDDIKANYIYTYTNNEAAATSKAYVASEYADEQQSGGNTGGEQGGGEQGGGTTGTQYSVNFTGSELGNTVYCYYYSGNSNNTWPGTAMTKDSGNTYSLSWNGTYQPAYVIFNNGSGKQYPASTGFAFENGATYNKDGKVSSTGGGNTGGGTGSNSGVYVMGIGGDWATGVACSTPSDNQSSVVIKKWAANTIFKVKVDGTWYGSKTATQNNPTVLQNGIWFNNVQTGNENDNFTLPASATGRDVTITIATDNGHLVASWPTVDNPSTAATYPGGVPKQGVVFNNDDTATFCLLAPMKWAVSISGSWNDYASSTLMNYQDYNGYRYFWTTISGIDKSTWYTYFYTVDETYRVNDPYSPVILDPEYDSTINSGAWADRPAYPAAATSLKSYPDSEKTTKGSNGDIPSQKVRVSAIRGDIHDTYTWNVTNFTPVDRGHMNIYELHVGDFNGTNGERNGEGSFKKAQAKLDYLVELGINVIELMPVMEFDMNHNWGYDTNSHFAVDKQYGSPTDLKDFIDACHAKGIAVVLDMVFNHATDNHPWKVMYAPGTSPFFNTEAPHAWSVHNDFNQNYACVEPYYYDVLTYWLTNYKVDGFRFDLVKGMGNNESYDNNNFYGNDPNKSLVDRMKRLHAHMNTINPNVLHINEAFINYSDECALNADGQMVWLHQCSEAQKFVKGDHSVAGYGNLDHTTAEANGRGSFGTINYGESHDEPWLGYVAKTSANTNISGTLKSRMDRLSSYAAQMYITHGPKMIWQFCELGYDVEALAGDGYERIGPKEVHWEFLDVPERQNLRNTYRSMMAVRNQNPDMFVATATPVFKDFGDNENARAVQVQANGKELILFVNPSTHEAKSYTFTNSSKNPLIWVENYKVISATAGYTPEVSSSSGSVTVKNIPANGYCLLATKNVNFDITLTGGTQGGEQGGDTPAKKTVALAGKFNDWSTTKNVVEIEGTVATFTIENYSDGTGTDAGFKFVYNGEYYGGATITNGEWTSALSSDNSANMLVNATGTVTFKFATDTKACLVSWGSEQGGGEETPEYVVAVLGAFNNWSSTANTSSDVNSNCVHIIVPNWTNTKSGQDDGFKVKVNDTWYGFNGTITKDNWVDTSTSGDNMKLPADAEGKTVDFTIAVDNGHFCATWSEVSEPVKEYVYLVGDMNSWNQTATKAEVGEESKNCAIFRVENWQDYEFKFIYNNAWYGKGVELTSGETWTELSIGGGEENNIKLVKEANGQNVTLTFAVDTHKVNVIFTGSTGVEGIEAEAAEAVYYNLQGVRVENPATGIYILRQGDKVSKVMVK